MWCHEKKYYCKMFKFELFCVSANMIDAPFFQFIALIQDQSNVNVCCWTMMLKTKTHTKIKLFHYCVLVRLEKKIVFLIENQPEMIDLRSNKYKRKLWSYCYAHGDGPEEK